MKENKRGNVFTKDHSSRANILAFWTSCLENFSSMKNVSPTLALTLRGDFLPKIPQNTLAFGSDYGQTVIRIRKRFERLKSPQSRARSEVSVTFLCKSMLEECGSKVNDIFGFPPFKVNGVY